MITSPASSSSGLGEKLPIDCRVLMVVGTEALRRQTAAEFPDATFCRRARGPDAGIGSTTSGGRAARPVVESEVEQIERLSVLKEKGMLSKEEFAMAKREVLGL